MKTALKVLTILILGCVISLFTEFEQTFLEFNSGGYQAVLSEMSSIKDISVPNLSVKIQSANIVSNKFADFGGRFNGRLQDVHFTARRKSKSALCRVRGERSREQQWAPRFGERFSNPIGAIVSRSLSGVREDEFEFHHSIFPKAFSARGQNVGSQFLFAGLSSRTNLPNDADKLQESYKSQNSSKNHQPPVGRSFLTLLFGYIGGFFVALYGLHLLARNRVLLGWCLLCFAVLSAIVGVAY